ncbi:Type II toxin-antitoxin system Phd/YefM family antitoxin [Candidatus Magnetomoraceae bacterium gMMP-15]
MTTVSVEEIRYDILGWLQKAQVDEKIIILKSNKPIAEIIPIRSDSIELRPMGLCKGDFTVPDDFDAPLPEEIIQQFEGI